MLASIVINETGLQLPHPTLPSSGLGIKAALTTLTQQALSPLFLSSEAICVRYGLSLLTEYVPEPMAFGCHSYGQFPQTFPF